MQDLKNQKYIENLMDYQTVVSDLNEMKALYTKFYDEFSYPITEDEDGYVVIRFIVNCKGTFTVNSIVLC